MGIWGLTLEIILDFFWGINIWKRLWEINMDFVEETNMGNFFGGNEYGKLLWKHEYWIFFSSFFDWCAVSIENVLENEHLKFEKCVFGKKWHILFKNDQKSITSSNLVPRWSPDGPQRPPKPITSCGRPPKAITSWRPVREYSSQTKYCSLWTIWNS